MSRTLDAIIGVSAIRAGSDTHEIDDSVEPYSAFQNVGVSEIWVHSWTPENWHRIHSQMFRFLMVAYSNHAFHWQRSPNRRTQTPSKIVGFAAAWDQIMAAHSLNIRGVSMEKI